MITVGERCMRQLSTILQAVATAASARYERNRDAAVPFTEEDARPFLELTDDESDEVPDYGLGFGIIGYTRTPEVKIKVATNVSADAAAIADDLKGRILAAIALDYTLGGYAHNVEPKTFHWSIDETENRDPLLIGTLPVEIDFITIDGQPDQQLTA